MRVSGRSVLKWLAVALAAAFVGIQFVPVVVSNPAADESRSFAATARVTPEVAALVERSCNDCHSSKTRWPWYARVAPASWFMARHVREGRRELSFSEWGTYTPRRAARKLGEICERVRAGEMPLKSYLILHPSARLSEADRKLLCDWAEAERARLAAGPEDAAR
jgi:hypothetical protein